MWPRSSGWCMMPAKKTAALLIGFGGPTRPGEVKPFLQGILEGAKISEQRLREVERHYEAIGGVSPFNAITNRQKEALEFYFKSLGMSLPVGVAFRHSTPTFLDAFQTFEKFGIQKVVGFVLISFRSFVSLGRYHEKVEQGRTLADAGRVDVCYTDSFDQSPLYFEAQAERVREAWGSWSAQEKASTFVIYTAHSIPVTMCEQSCRENQMRCYAFQFYEAARSVSERMNLGKNWTFAYQSRSGNPQDLWLEPGVLDVIRRLDIKKFKRVLCVPLGFLCDNVEVIYDLDIEAKQCCEKQGLQYFRASTVSDHPKFIKMMAQQILEKI